ncbi:MAG: putative DNA binding domain-containing protein, partial [Planctomycetes bacterium]|nr:putative DNA binding domain-containing protein [Planctomycetota bacterium]
KTLEFKRDASSSGPILRTLSAFSNTAGGTLLLGVRDRTREVVGVADPLEVEEQIMSIAADGIRPQILPEVEIVSVRKVSLVVVTVFPGPRRPYYLASQGRDAGSFVRVGSTNRRASAELLAELERTSRNVAFDEEPMTRLTVEDLDLDLARARFANRKKLGARDLLALNVLTRHGRHQVPTVGGVVLFGRDRLQHFPDARIRLARFAGTDRARITDRIEAETDPVQAIEEALAFLRRSTALGMAVEGARRRDLPQYPPVALREAVINAVAHADYSQVGSPIRIAVFDDRVEIESPGLLPFGLTIEEMQRGVSKLRNRVIGRVFHELGLIEQWGSGIRRMSEACAEMGLSAPTFEEFGTCFRVTLHSRAQRAHSPGGTAGSILELLKDGVERSTAKIAAALGVTPRTTRTHLKRLVEAGLVVEIGRSKSDPTKVYRVVAS